MFHVLSFDSKKVEISRGPDGQTIVRKRTTQSEYQNIVLARQHLLKHRPILSCVTGRNIFISVAEVYEWEEKPQVLSTLFYDGDNLEWILRSSTGKERSNWLKTLKKIFEIFKSIGFLWGDFAPRNMIWDRPKNTLWLVDFERGLHLKDCPVEQDVFNRYVRSYSREEFACFLSKKEQSVVFRDLLDEYYVGSVPSGQVASKRKMGLLRNLFGEKDCYSIAELRQAEDMMVFIATPFFINEVLFFPMDSLDRIGSKGGPNEYVDAVMAIRNLDDNTRFSEIKRRAEAL